MLVVKLEIWPHGSEVDKREIDSFIIGNNLTCENRPDCGNYDVIHKEERHNNCITNHVRYENVWKLVKKAIDVIMRGRDD